MRRRKAESGQGLVEYGLVVTMLTATVFGVFPTLGPLWRDQVKNIGKAGGEGQATMIAALGVNYGGTPPTAPVDDPSVGSASTGSGPSGSSVPTASTGSGPSGASAPTASTGSGPSGSSVPSGSGGSGGSSLS